MKDKFGNFLNFHDVQLKIQKPHKFSNNRNLPKSFKCNYYEAHLLIEPYNLLAKAENVKFTIYIVYFLRCKVRLIKSLVYSICNISDASGHEIDGMTFYKQFWSKY